MKLYKKMLMIGATVMMIGTGCSNDNTHNERENRVQRELTQKPQEKTALDRKVEKAFEKHLSVYPVKSLEDFYDMEGFKDGEFDKDDKGTWVLNSNISEQKDKNSPLISKGIVLYINRNTHSAKGYIVIKELYDELKKDRETEYKVVMKNGEIKLIDEAPTEIKEFLKSFKYLVEDKSFGDIDDFKKIRSIHNQELPLYSIDYHLSKDNPINQWIQQHYKLNESDALLKIKRTGSLEGTSLANFEFKVEYPTKMDEVKYFGESITFQPSREV